MRAIEVDLTQQPRGCAEHPLVKLKNLIKNVSGDVIIKVKVDTTTIPLSTLKILSKRAGLNMEITKEEPPVYEVVFKII